MASPQQPFAEVWSVEVEVLRDDKLELAELDVMLKHDFPLSLPKVTVSRSRAKELGYPLNINTEGVICTFDATTTTTNAEAPGELVKACVQRAIEILERDPSGGERGYGEEFIAYWEGRYPGELSVDLKVLSLVAEEEAHLSSVTYVRLLGRLGPFQAVIYSDAQAFNALATTLKVKGIGCKEQPTFYLGVVDFPHPPFHLRNHDVQRLVDKLSAGNAFGRYLAAYPEWPIITFSQHLKGRHLVFGWHHKPLIAARSGRHQRRKPRARVQPRQFLREERFTYVERFSPQVATQARLERRTAEAYAAVSRGGPFTLLVAGVGSIGSQLTGLLASLNWQEMRLIDPDLLTLENLKRHLLGLSWIGHYKVDGVRGFLLDKNPLGAVQVRTDGLVKVATEDPAFLNECDYLIVCTGDANAEMWLNQAQQEGHITQPVFFIWVEPYAAGGHCVFVNGQDRMRLADLFDGQHYKHNIIAVEEHARRTFTRREAGCQTSYVPFANAPLMSFLARLFPEIATIMRTPEHPSCRLTWSGDLAALQQLGIEVAAGAEGLGSFGFEKMGL